MRRLAGPHIEAGMVPWAADDLAIDKTFGERSVVMAAMGIEGEDVRSRSNQDDLLLADMAQQGGAGEFRQGDALGEVGSGRSRLLIGHDFLHYSALAQSTIPRNSCRVSALSRKQPSMRLVTRSVSGLCTPRVVMQ